MPRRRTDSSNGNRLFDLWGRSAGDLIGNRREGNGAAVLNSIYAAQRAFFARLNDPRRDIDDECGYPKGDADAHQLQELNDRDPIAARVNSLMPQECWQISPWVYEDEDPQVRTPFEEAWDALGGMLRGENSHYREEEGSPVWEYLRRVDELSGVGRYGVMLFGFDDVGTDDGLRNPVEGWGEEGSLPVEGRPKELGEGPPKDGSNGQASKPRGAEQKFPQRNKTPRYRLTVNAERTRGRKLLFLRPFGEALAPVVRWETNPSSPRFGQPHTYQISFNDPRELQGGLGFPMATRDVHWSRVLHVADCGHHAVSSEVFARPRVLPVLNRILDLQKIYGADGESFWRNAMLKLFFETHPQLGGDVEVDDDDLRDMMERMGNGLQAWGRLSGMSAKPIAPAVADPAPHVKAHIEAICIRNGWPYRIFVGSERGELASSQDERAHQGRLAGRRSGYLTPRLIVPFVDRLIAAGVLPAPAKTRKVKSTSAVRPELPFDQEVEAGEEEVPTVEPGAPFGRGEEGEDEGKKPNPFARNRAYGPPGQGPEEDEDDEEELEAGDGLDAGGLDVDELEEGQEGAEGEKGLTRTEPGGYCVVWPDWTAMSDTEKAAVASQNTATLAAYIQGGGETVVPLQYFLTSRAFMNMDDGEARAILEDAALAQIEKEMEDIAKQQQMMDQQEEAIDRGLAPDPTDPDQTAAQPPPGQPGFPPAPGEKPAPGKTPPQLAPFAAKPKPEERP